MRADTAESLAFRVLPAGVLLVAYAGVCALTGTVWPWGEVVHEDGSRTLLGTVFFFEHTARELLPNVLLAVGVAGAVQYYFPLDAAGAGALARSRRRLGAIAGLMLFCIVGGTLWTDGAQGLVDNLSQLHTREGAPLVWGAHWRYHLIERVAQILLAFSVAGAVWMLRGRPDPGRRAGRFRLYGTALVLCAVTTVVFRLTSEPFRDPAFLGHQLRELFTHALVTLPLALGVCLGLARSRSGGRMSSAEPLWPIVVTGGVAVASGAFLLVASLLADAQSHGQATGLAALLFPHFFEHSAGYVLVPSLAGWLYGRPVNR